MQYPNVDYYARGKIDIGIIDRFKSIRSDLEMTQVQLGKALGIGQGGVSKVEKGNRQLDTKVMSGLANLFQVSINWLLTGIGPRYLTETEPPRADDADFSYIPLIEAKLSAGDGSLVVSETIKVNCAFRTEWLQKTVGPAEGKFLLGVIGDSMAPSIKNGDTVLIDIQATHIFDGNIYALRMDSTIMIKRLALLPDDKVRLISDNKQEYDPIDANRKDIHVLGRVVWFARTLVKPD